MFLKWSVLGQEKTLSRLEKDILKNSPAHCYLFSGPKGVGKSLAAKEFCANLQADGDELLFEKLLKGGDADFNVLADNGEKIKVAEVRSIIAKAHQTAQGRYKFFLIENVERMTTEAANSFLKVIEEPPGQSIFILVTSSIGLVPATVVSRARVVRFRQMEETVLRSTLKKMFTEVTAEQLRLFSSFSAGSLGKAITLIKDEARREQFIHFYELANAVLDEQGLTERFQTVKILKEEAGKENVSKFFQEFLNVFIFVLRERVFFLNSRKNLKDVNLINRTIDASEDLGKNVNSTLVLEDLFLSI